jgi:hypothetical protein
VGGGEETGGRPRGSLLMLQIIPIQPNEMLYEDGMVL